MVQDSTGMPIDIGDSIRFRGQVYTIKGFLYGLGRYGTAVIEFEEDNVHTKEIPDEISVDRI